MQRTMVAALGTLPIAALSLLPKSAVAEPVWQPVPAASAVAQPSLTTVDWRDNDRGNNTNDRDWRTNTTNTNDRDWRNSNTNTRDRDWRDRDSDRRDRDWRDRDSDRRDRDWRNDRRYDSDRRSNDWRNSNQQNSRNRVWIPGHWERGFLGIGRKWVAGHYDDR